MNKILVFIENPFSENRDIERFGFNFFEKNNYEIIIVDCALLFNKTHSWKFLNNNYEVKNIENISEIANLLKEDKYSFAIDLLAYDHAAFKVRNLLEVNKILTIKKQGALPIYQKKYLSLKKEFLKNYFFAKGFKHSIGISTGLDSDKNFFIKRALKKIYSHSDDYDKMINYKESYYKQNKKYILFIDDMLPNHPDYKNYVPPKPNPANEKIYFNELEFFFKKIEDLTGFEVIIALHPKSSIKKWNQVFSRRKIFIYNTLKLVKNCECVLVHESTAISFPVMFKKTVIFLSSDEIENSWIYINIVGKAKWLNAEVLNITKFNSSNKKIDVKNFDDLAFNNYLKNFIKHPLSTNALSWQSVLEIIDNT